MNVTALQTAPALLVAGLIAGCNVPLDQVNEAPPVGALSGSYACPLASRAPYDLGPAHFDGSLDVEGFTPGLRTQGCAAQQVDTTRGTAIQVRLLQHTGFQRGQVLELHFPLDALAEGALSDGRELVFAGRGGFGSLLSVAAGDAEVIARVVGGAARLDAWGTDEGAVIEGSFEELRLGAP